MADQQNSDLLSLVERAVVYTPQAGDIVVIEVATEPRTQEDMDRMKDQAHAAFGMDVKIVVVGGGAHFAGVVRRD